MFVFEKSRQWALKTVCFFGTPPYGKIHEENPQRILYGKIPGKKFIREITKEFYMGKYMV